MPTMTVRDALKTAEESLLRKGLEDACVEAEMLLCHVLKKDRIYLYAYGKDPMDKDACPLFFDLLERRLEGEPLQYLLGTAEFMGITLRVNPSVLIPRQDTELLAETAIAELASRRKMPGTTHVLDLCTIHVLDLCTGSGALAIAIAKLAPGVSVCTTDLSPEALAVAEKNAEEADLPTPISFFQGDLFHALPPQSRFDVIVTNPPYISTAVIETLDVQVRGYEPRAALDGGEDGLVLIRQILSEAPMYLNAGGVLLMEIGYDQGEAVASIAGREGGPFAEVRILKDLEKNDRVLLARMK